MGFLSGIMGGGKQKIPASGFFAMPQDYQDFYNNLLNIAKNTYTSGNKLKSSSFIPLSETADEKRAYELLRQGFYPTEQRLQSDISMLMNPFNQNVIDEINRQAGGDYSLVKQNLAEQGQLGSNRQMLGASDVDLRRTGQIGQFMQNQYNTALNQALTQLPALRSADVQGLLGIGQQQRALDWQTKQAPINALSSGMGTLSGIPTQFGNFGTPEQTIKTGGGFLSNLVSTVAPMALNAVVPGAGTALSVGMSTLGRGSFGGGMSYYPSSGETISWF